MALDPRYITAIDLSPYLVDKDSGAPLANGVVSFWQDAARTVPKLVYELSGAPPNYTYTALPNPIILSNTGTFQDAAGNNIAVYYFPYDSQLPDANVQLYYITVTNSMGTEQFTREAWPNIVTNESQTLTQADISNALTNPQFATVLFNPSNSLTITTTGSGTLSTTIAPGWILNLTTLGIGSVTVTRNSIAGSTAYPYNPPYTLTVAPGANITALTLSQRLYHNPSIWSPQPGGTNGYIASSILLAPLSSAIMQYAPSTGAVQELLNANNTLGVYQEFTNTIQLTSASNTDNADVGYVDIIVSLPIGATTTFSNVQIVGLETNEPNVVYDQTPVNRQIDYMFHYYNPLLQYKPTSSYLIGWDFPFNPYQFLGPAVPVAAIGANKSSYVWDQTILFQSVNSGIGVSRTSSGAISLTAAAAGQMALIQYLPQETARKILNDYMAVNIAAMANSTPITATVSLWYTTDANLPSVVGSNNSIVATLDANGKPATFNGNWFEVPRSNLGNAQFTIGTSTTTNFNNYPFTGWNMNGIAECNTATYFAIVVGTGTVPNGNSVSFDSISLCDGQIPTRPASMSPDLVLRQCQRYYSMSFDQTAIPATGLGLTEGMVTASVITNRVTTYVNFPVSMITNPVVTIYNPVNANDQMYDMNQGVDCNTTTINYPVATISQNGFTISALPPANVPGHVCGFYWTADARLGQ
jgi:hypothetical protein